MASPRFRHRLIRFRKLLALQIAFFRFSIRRQQGPGANIPRRGRGIFDRHNVLRMLLAKGKITQGMITLLDKWRHTGFNVFFGPRILPRQENSMENLARYTIRASLSQERMTYHREIGKVEYQSKDEKKTKVFDALECLADMCSHVPKKGGLMVRYYNVCCYVDLQAQSKPDVFQTKRQISVLKIPAILDCNHRLIG